MLATLILAAVSAAAIELETSPAGRHYFRVVGGAAGSMVVFVEGSDSSAPPMLGTQSQAGADLLFQPRFALQPGVSYRVEFTDKETLQVNFRLREPQTAPGVVENAYPSSRNVPENLLKIYLYFSTPMARGEVYSHLHLFDIAGGEIEQPFLELGEELWDPQMRRLTVLFDPGRVKRALIPNREVGAPLQAGRSYILQLDDGLRDAAGKPLLQEFRKRFDVGPADRRSPDPLHWGIQAPRVGSREPLSLAFLEPLDHALLMRTLSITDAAGRTIQGSISLGVEEQLWQFRPTAHWQAGSYRNVIDPVLEDLAGNRIGRLFDEDMTIAPGLRKPPTTSLWFRVDRTQASDSKK